MRFPRQMQAAGKKIRMESGTVDFSEKKQGYVKTRNRVDGHGTTGGRGGHAC
jgi:hypothetical protein